MMHCKLNTFWVDREFGDELYNELISNGYPTLIETSLNSGDEIFWLRHEHTVITHEIIKSLNENFTLDS